MPGVHENVSEQLGHTCIRRSPQGLYGALNKQAELLNLPIPMMKAEVNIIKGWLQCRFTKIRLKAHVARLVYRNFSMFLKSLNITRNWSDFSAPIVRPVTMHQTDENSLISQLCLCYVSMLTRRNGLLFFCALAVNRLRSTVYCYSTEHGTCTKSFAPTQFRCQLATHTTDLITFKRNSIS